MIEGRGAVSSVEETKATLEKMGAVFKSDYAFKDIIFVPKKTTYSLSDDFLRARVYTKNDWPTKKVVLVRKQTEFKSAGKVSHVSLRHEFDKEEEARIYINQTLGAEFAYGFEYSRKGWQYDIDNCRIFVEDIEHLGPSMEIEAETGNQLQTLFDRIGIAERSHDSVPEMVRRSIRKPN